MAVPIADLAVCATIGQAAIHIPLVASGLLHAVCVGAVVGLFGILILEAFLPKLRRRIGWPRILKGALLLAIGTAIGQALTNPVIQRPAPLDMPLIDTLLQALFSTLLALWLLGFARRKSVASTEGTNRSLPLQVRAGIAIFLTAMMLALVAPLESLTEGMKAHQGHNSNTVLSLARNQRHLAEKLAKVDPRTAASDDGNQAAEEHIRGATEVAHAQSRLLLDLLKVSSNVRRLFSAELEAAYGRASAAANAMRDATSKLGTGHPTADIKRALQHAGEAHLAAVDEALSILGREHETETDIAVSNQTIRGLAVPAASAFLILVVAIPIVRNTQRQRAAALEAWRDARTAEARVTTLRETLDKHFAITITGLDGRIIDANQRFSDLSGYTREELIGNSYSLLNSSEFTPERLGQMWATVLAGQTWSGEFCDRAKDGSFVWVESIVAPLRNEKGVIDSCITIGTDVTAIHRQALTLQAMIDHFPGGILLVDKNLKVVGSNALYRRFLDLPDGLFDDQTSYADILWLRAQRGDYGEGDLREQVELRLDFMRSTDPHNYERTDQHGRILEVRSAPIAGGGRLTTYFDVTERHNAAIELQRAHGRLEAFIKHAPAAVAMFDRDMRYVAHSDRWLQDYGLCGQALVGRNHYEVFPEVPDHWKAKHKRILAGATEMSPEERFRRADGSENIIRWEVRPWYGEDNQVGGIMMLTEEISERKRMEEQLWQLAKLDALTSLPNRLNFNEQLSSLIADASAKGMQFAVGLIDLDRFKEINDILGHDAGDTLLKEVAARLQSALQEYGTVARLGGDEFALLIGCPEGQKSLAAPVQAMFDAMEAPVELGGVPRKCGMSMGITLYPIDAQKPSDLLKNADLALYRAKAIGRDRCEYFAPDMRTSIEKSYKLHNEVREALVTDALFLAFQPIIPLAPDRPVSFEALLRWRHPERGLLSPGDFEEIFNDPKVAAEIGKTVIDLALRQAMIWQAAGLEFGRIAVNVTSADFALGGFAERLQDKLLAYGVKPEKLCIEVTESVFLGRGAVGVAEILDKLNELGVEIALDDFGTGFASLSHIKSFPIDRLKIDRSFVCDMEYNADNLSIVGAIIQLGRSLGISITAEGVENASQLNLLRSLGCDCIQGYLFSKPLEPALVPEFLKGKSKTKASLVA